RKGSRGADSACFEASLPRSDSYFEGGFKSSYSARAAVASPRRSEKPTTFIRRTPRSSAMVTTSPGLTACPGDFSRTPLTRTCPLSTSAAALVRAFTTRACHSHLSRRCRSNLILASQLLLERRELCEGRVRIGGAIVARRGAGRVLAVRRPGFAVPAVAALVTIAAAAFRPILTLEFVAALVFALALKALAAIAAFVTVFLALVVASSFTRRALAPFPRLSV